ncbi:DUF1571 domain-containing protein [Planctomyces sp. SH-PL62]|uniref:DUF1571 domain-containing protein n=1 Tax=Planctomyces sp. SH-PL62 TaxID=1636152 RepID=UPI00078B83C7|nr:DUF1571 domain-containing protein [Planctomyces sp. SH-PL62]AMV39467.1 hypothetical protein VT85_18660 [Planctomyces sp. SH-PL62]
MTWANAEARQTISVRRTMLIVAAATATICGQLGCATSQALQASAGAMSSMLWSRAPSAPGYDLYAEGMAGSKAVKDAEALAAGPDRKPQAGAEGRYEGEPASDGRTTPALAATRPRSRGTADESVRVTLGRPESLPVLRDPDGAAGPLMASAAPDPAPAAVAAEPRPVEPPAELAPAPPELAAADLAPAPPEAVADDLATEPIAEPAPAQSPPPALAQAKPGGEAPVGAAGPSLKSILDEARARLEAMSTYQVSITRVERVGNQVLPEEKALLSIRRKPKAVRLEWPDGANKGREVIYSAAINDRVMHVNIANSAIPIPRMSIPVDSPLALRNSRHAITEAGFDTIFNNLASQVDSQGRPTGAEGRLTYKGVQKPKDVDRECHLIQRITPTREVWRVYLDADSLMPVVVTAHQADGALLESYRYDGLKADPTELAAADAFDPDKRWGESKGLFSRLAKAASAASDQPAPTATR